MSRQRIIERETRLRPYAVATSVLPLILLLVAGVIQSNGAVSGDLATDTLRSIDANRGSFLLGSVMGGVAFLMLAFPLVYLFRAAQVRSERVMGAMIGLVAIGPILYGLRALLLALAQVDIAEQFVAQEEGVGDIYSLSANLFENSDLLGAASLASSVGLLALVIAMIYTLLWAVRTGLVTRFFGTLGMALGASLILPPLAPLIVPILLAWFMYFGVMLAGRAPRGRPPAWDAGEAIPWPAPGSEPLAAAGAGGGEVVEGDATEIPGVDENPNAARRERAKRRKRKRRR